MHILLIHRAFAQSNQPGGTRHIELSRALVSKGHRITVVTSTVSYLQADSGRAIPAPSSRETIEPGIEVIRCGGGTSGGTFFSRLGGMFGFMFRGFAAGLSVRNVDLVWATSPTLFQALAAFLVGLLKHRPVILEIRDIWPDALEDIGALRNPLAIAVSRALAQVLYKNAKVIIINSPGFRAHLIACGVPAAKIHLVANGVDIDMFDPNSDGSDMRTQLDWQGKYVVLYSGAHGMANDLDTLLDAARGLKDFPEARIVLLGDGPEKARLIARAQAEGLDNVQFLDAVPKNEMAQILTATDCCVAHLKPSAMQAMVYPNKVFDYMAAARPTVLGIGGVIREVIEQAQGGLCTEPGDAEGMAAAIRRLARSPAEAKAMGRRARTHVETHFQRQVIAESLLRVLQEFASPRSR